MPAFGCNSITCAFARRVLYEPVRGFRLSDRVVSAVDRFIGALSRFLVPGDPPGVMNRWLFIYPFVGASDWTHALNLADAPGSGYQGGNISVPATAPTGNFDRFAFLWSGSVTHNQNGVTMNSGSGGYTGIDTADITNYYNAWQRKSHGIYSRTNSAVNSYDFSAQFVEPRNGFTYTQGIISRYATDGNLYGDLCLYTKAGVPGTPNRIGPIAVADSLGLYSDNQRGSFYGSSHYLYKRGVVIGTENTVESGMGYGDAGSGAWMYLLGTGRNYAFFFSTRNLRVLEGTRNSDGSGGQLPGNNAEFNYFVEQFQVGLNRGV